ncbi:MAG: outer membrane beta-barrel protein [Phormidesmis sp. CAN_BIN44]|nr:outer membrane beta-barrel protein [Phormidesmis sp. CAN_BIN44]
MRVSPLITFCIFVTLGSCGLSAIAQAAPDLVVPTRQLPINPDPAAFPSDQTAPPDAQPLDPEDTKSEVGEIRILDRPAVAERRQPDVQLLLRSSVFSSSNITSLSTFRPSDTVFINSALLLATPKLSETTRLIASAGGGLVRFANRGDSNYNLLNFNVAVQQRIAPGTYSQLGWVQENLYRSGTGDRLLQDNSVQFILGRQDQLGQQLRLDSFYELRASFTNPDDQNRVANTLGARLRYDITPKLQGALDYRLTFKNFTQVDRSDAEHQIGALAVYNINSDVFVAGSVSYLFGRSSSASIDLDNLSVGVSLGWNVPLF